MPLGAWHWLPCSLVPIPGRQLYSQGSQMLPLWLLQCLLRPTRPASHWMSAQMPQAAKPHFSKAGSRCLYTCPLFLLILFALVSSVTLVPWPILSPLSLSPPHHHHANPIFHPVCLWGCLLSSQICPLSSSSVLSNFRPLNLAHFFTHLPLAPKLLW